MSLFHSLDDYFEFMMWFKTNSPKLHLKYWSNIEIPTGSDGVKIRTRDMSVKTLKILNGLTKEYYGKK